MNAAAVVVLVMPCLVVSFGSTVGVAVAAAGADVDVAGVELESGSDSGRDGSDMDKVVVSARM